MKALEIKNITTKLSSFTLQQMDMQVEQGSVMGLIGRNGAGKTTLMKSILRLLDYEGEVFFYGKTLQDDHVQVCQEIAYVGTETEFTLSAKVKAIQKVFKEFYPAFDEERFLTLCSNSGIQQDHKIGKLSLGQCKLFQIYLAICRKPKLLLLDEPMANLDPITRREINELLREFMIEEDHAILISSHLLSDLEKIVDYVTLIDQGKKILSDDINTLQEEYYEVVYDTNLDERVIVKVKDHKALCRIQDRKILEGLQYQRADLETIMYYLCERMSG